MSLEVGLRAGAVRMKLLRQFAVSVVNGWRGAWMEFARRWRLAFRGMMMTAPDPFFPVRRPPDPDFVVCPPRVDEDGRVMIGRRIPDDEVPPKWRGEAGKE